MERTVTWIWSDDHRSVTALITSLDDPEKTVSIPVVTETAVVKEPGCEEPGLTDYTATATDEDDNEYSDIQTEIMPASGHSYKRVGLWQNGDRATGEFVCEGCGKSIVLDVTVTEEEEG